MDSFKPYSKRQKPPPNVFRYDISHETRVRILKMLEVSTRKRPTYSSSTQDFYRLLLEKASTFALLEYGRWFPLDEGKRTYQEHEDGLNHLLGCPDEHFLDFCEFLFTVTGVAARDKFEEKINAIFQDEGIGYELTPFREIFKEVTDGYGTRRVNEGWHYPKVILKDGEYIHNEVVRPCLEALASPGLEIAHAEMLKAHLAYRKAHYADSITDAASSFESVMKTICSYKGWTFEQDKDTCSKLVAILRENGLFHPFYTPVLEAVGTIRNKISDAHGRGPMLQHPVSKENADHMLQMTSAHITFLVKLSGI